MLKSLHAYRTADNKTLTNRAYTRDIRDRITSYLKGTANVLNGLENGRGDFFSYDEEGQLMGGYYEATDSAGSGAERAEQFHYDALGNRVGSNVLGSEGNVDFTRRDNGLNQYLNWSLAAPGNYLHDDQFYGTPGNGVLMQEGMITASYNALNQPIAIYEPSLGGDFLWFGYDPLGRCVKRWMAPAGGGDPATNPATYFYSDSSWNLLQEGASSASVSRTYVHGARVDDIVASSPDVSAGQWYYHHYDARGHAILLTNVNGNLIEQYEYDAFGEPYLYDAAGAVVPVEQTKGNRFLFTGREWLKELHLYDYRNRLYHPLLGRFMQPDPKQFLAGDYNLYRYCHNDPINHTDPTGLYVTYGGDWTEKDAENFRKIFDAQWKTKEGRAAFEKMYASKDEFRIVPDRAAGTSNGGAAGFNIFTPAPADYKGPTYDSNSPMAGGQSNRNFEKKQQGDNTAANRQAHDAAREGGIGSGEKDLLRKFHETDKTGMTFQQMKQLAADIKANPGNYH